MSYTVPAFAADAVATAYAALLSAWVLKVRFDGDLLSPLQALSRTRGVLWVGAAGFATAAGVAVCVGIVEGAAVTVGVCVACVIIEAGRRFVGPTDEPYEPGRGWTAVLRWVLWVGMVVAGLVGFAAVAAMSEAAGGIFGD
ncbi:hypothetical protein ACLQ3K_06575 [Tsukamurella sp. DT100]|uniref:hypothetical protein n=1 Tax=Tsukamurella sp. DT100 TaxID=3393415 RepID=UPI003CE8EB92